ncbi:MAG: hypothetical protein WBB43_12235, partial [Limnoraphis sp.]
TPLERMPSALLGKLNLVSQLVERGSPDSDVWNLRCLRRRGCQSIVIELSAGLVSASRFTSDFNNMN